jgi:aminopeptidase N
MQDIKRYKRGFYIFTIGFILNLVFSFLLFAGARLIAGNAHEKEKDALQLAKKEGIYVGGQVLDKIKEYFSKNGSNDLREESPLVLASQNSYDALKYDLSLSFNIPAKTISGELFMHALSYSDTLQFIYINLYDNLKVTAVSYSIPENHLTGEDDIRFISSFSPASYSQNKDYLIIDLGTKILREKEFIIKINYSGSPKRLGFDSFSFKEIKGNMCIYTLSEPNYGPTWWPSKDLPNDKALYSMRLIVPRGFKAVSNGLLQDTVQNDDNTTTFNWRTKYPIASYLVSLVVSHFSIWEQTYKSVDGTKTMPVVYYAFPADSLKSVTDWSVTPEMISYLSKTFGEYPFIDEKYGMAQFGWVSGAMEHQTVTSMSYFLLTGDNRFDNVVIHELAHQWFGDAVTLKDWKNIWLNEGFASYCEALWREHKNGKTDLIEAMKNFDAGYFKGTVYAPDGFIDNYAIYTTIYNKGAWVLHMLRGVMGDSLFFDAMRVYYDRYKYSNAETSQLVSVCEEVYGAKLDWFFDEWVYTGTGRPSYEYSWRYEDFQNQKGSGVYSVWVNLKQVQKNDLELYKMPVRFTVVTSEGEKEFTEFNDKAEQICQLVVNSEPKDVILDKDGWILKKVTVKKDKK